MRKCKKGFLVFFLCFSSFFVNLLFAAQFQVRLLPTYSYLTNGISNASIGGSISLDFSPITLRINDNPYISLQGTYLNLFEEAIDSEQYFDYGAGLGYSLRLADKFYLYPEINGGLWNIQENTKTNLPSQNGYYIGARLSAEFSIMPELNAGIFAGYKLLNLPKRNFAQSISGGFAFTYNFTKGLRNSSKLDVIEQNLQPLYPVFYSHYSNHPFGTITLKNNEEAYITNVRVYFYNQYMLTKSLIAEYPKIKQGDSVEIEITALLNESILNQLSDSVTDGTITVEYRLLNKNKDFTFNLSFTTLSRNSMSWADDRQAAAFVSPRDASAQKFARQVKSIVKSKIRTDIPVNIQYASAIFWALKEYGLNYVIDPSSAYSDNDGGLSIDFLQFPYQTLTYHGGDCDDLSILNCSLLEALGIETAFITIPGHIYIAFDSGVSPEEAEKSISGGKYIIRDDKVWIPYEITLCTDTFDLALRTGYSQWTKAGETAALIPLKEAWLAFKAVSVPESDASIELPERDDILKAFTSWLNKQ